MRRNRGHTRDGLARGSQPPEKEVSGSAEVYGVGVEAWGMARVGQGGGQEGGQVAGCLRFSLAIRGLIFCPAGPWSPEIRRLPKPGPQPTAT